MTLDLTPAGRGREASLTASVCTGGLPLSVPLPLAFRLPLLSASVENYSTVFLLVRRDSLFEPFLCLPLFEFSYLSLSQAFHSLSDTPPALRVVTVIIIY